MQSLFHATRIFILLQSFHITSLLLSSMTLQDTLNLEAIPNGQYPSRHPLEHQHTQADSAVFTLNKYACFMCPWLGCMHCISWTFWAPRGGLRCDTSRLWIVKKSIDLCATRLAKDSREQEFGTCLPLPPAERISPLLALLCKKELLRVWPRCRCSLQPGLAKRGFLIWHWYPFTARVDNPQSY